MQQYTRAPQILRFTMPLDIFQCGKPVGCESFLHQGLLNLPKRSFIHRGEHHDAGQLHH